MSLRPNLPSYVAEPVCSLGLPVALRKQDYTISRLERKGRSRQRYTSLSYACRKETDRKNAEKFLVFEEGAVTILAVRKAL